MGVVSVILEGDGGLADWRDYQIAEFNTEDSEIRVVYLPDATVSGKPCVGLGIKSENSVVFVQFTLAEFLSAASAIQAKAEKEGEWT